MKRIYTFAAALLFLGACTSDGYTIRGNVEGLESPYVYLITFNGTHNVADSAKVEAGAFTFTGKTELPEVAYLSRDKEQPFVRFFLETPASRSTATSTIPTRSTRPEPRPTRR